MINPEILVNLDTAEDLVLNTYLGWTSPLDFIKRRDVTQVKGYVSDPEFLNKVTGSLIVGITRHLESYDPNQQPDSIYWVGGRSINNVSPFLNSTMQANSRLQVLRLFRNVDENTEYPEYTYANLAGIDNRREAWPADDLGFLPNGYEPSPPEKHRNGDFLNGYGHTFGFICGALGDVTIDLPKSGNPYDAVMDNPITPADHLVSIALENARISREMLQQLAA